MLLVTRNGNNRVAVVEIAKANGDYWRIITSGVRRDEQFGEKIGARVPTPGAAAGQQPSFQQVPIKSGELPDLAPSPDLDLGGRELFVNFSRIEEPDDVRLVSAAWWMPSPATSTRPAGGAEPRGDAGARRRARHDGARALSPLAPLGAAGCHRERTWGIYETCDAATLN